MKRLLKSLAFVALLAALAIAYLSLSHQPEPFAQGSESARRLLGGPHPVAESRVGVIDTSRTTPANGDYAGSAQRLLEGRVWYPDSGPAPYPLLVFSHGFTSFHDNGEYLAEHLASYGFAVVAVDYPLTNLGAPGGPNVEDLVNQPGDISFLIDSLLVQSATSGHVLEGMIDGSRIGAFGISLGGLTSLLVGYHPQLGDPRVDAVVAIAAPTLFFEERFFSFANPALLMLAGTLDVLVPYEENARPALEKIPGAELVSVRGGSHTGFSGGTAMLRTMKNTDAVGCWSVTRNIDESNLEASARLFGGRDIGVDASARLSLCEVDPLPETMNVLRQQMIARVMVTAFFEREFAPESARREAAAQYLAGTAAAEIREISYQRAAAR